MPRNIIQLYLFSWLIRLAFKTGRAQRLLLLLLHLLVVSGGGSGEGKGLLLLSLLLNGEWEGLLLSRRQGHRVARASVCRRLGMRKSEISAKSSQWND